MLSGEKQRIGKGFIWGVIKDLISQGLIPRSSAAGSFIVDMSLQKRESAECCTIMSRTGTQGWTLRVSAVRYTAIPRATHFLYPGCASYWMNRWREAQAARTRSMGCTDVIVDYLGRQYIVEMKIYHGNEYNLRGENQLMGYLKDYHLQKGYMLSFNFNKKKQVGVREVVLGDKVIIEAIV